MGECFGIATEHHIDVIELAIDANGFGGDDEVIVCGRAFLFGAILGIGHDEEFFLEGTIGVVFRVLLGNEAAEVADNRAEVFAGGDHAPTANGMETNGNGFVGQQ